MAETGYQIVFRGRLVAGADEAEVKANLARLFKIEPARVEQLFGGGRKVLKQGLDRAAADRYRAVLRKAGAMVSVVNAETRSAAAERYRPAAKPTPAKRSRAVFEVDGRPPAETTVQASSEPSGRAVFEVDDPRAGESPPAAPSAAPAPAKDRAAEADADRSEPAPNEAEAALAPPGAQLTEPMAVSAPEISIDGLDLAEVGAIVDESERPPPLQVDLGGLSVSQDFERLDERPPAPPPEIESYDLDLADPDAVVDESARPPPPQIDLDGLSVSDDYEALDERPSAPVADIDIGHLTLEKD